MLKKLLSVLIPFAVIIMFSSASFAQDLDSGVYHGYNGSYWYDQGWVDYYNDIGGYSQSVYVHVYIYKNNDNIHYGERTTTVSPYQTSRCLSDKVQGSGGCEDYYITVDGYK